MQWEVGRKNNHSVWLTASDLNEVLDHLELSEESLLLCPSQAKYFFVPLPIDRTDFFLNSQSAPCHAGLTHPF